MSAVFLHPLGGHRDELSNTLIVVAIRPKKPDHCLKRLAECESANGPGADRRQKAKVATPPQDEVVRHLREERPSNRAQNLLLNGQRL